MKKNCKIEGCEKTVRTLGYCQVHYNDYYKEQNILTGKLCSVADCPQPQTAKQLCNKHYRRLRSQGDPEFDSSSLSEIKKRFWLRLNTGFTDQCWEWQGRKNKDGYGRFDVKIDNKQYTLAHRFAYFLEFSQHPNEMNVLHRCDNPACCNPNHLFLGDAVDNMADRQQKNRQIKGEMQGRSKLTTQKVKEIKKRLAANEKLSAIAKDYGVTVSNIYYISTGKIWGHITI